MAQMLLRSPTVVPGITAVHAWSKQFLLKNQEELIQIRSDKLWVRKPETLDNVDIAVVLFGQYIVR